MQDLKLALVAHTSVIGKKADNLAATAGWVKKAKRKGAALVCLPELGLTGHGGCPEMIGQAEPVPGGECVQTLCGLARELDIYICAGIAETRRGVHYNTQFVVGPGGYLGKQRKVHLSRDEYYYFRGGADLPVIGLPFVRVGIVICYDSCFPEVSRCLAIEGAELLLAVHAARFGKWPRTAAARRKIVADEKARWLQRHSVRALDNGVYVGLCNMAGRSAAGIKGVDANHAGGCMVIDPYGERVAQSRTRDIRDEMIVVPLKGDKVAARRRETCFPLRVRRPEVFAALTDPTA